MHFRAVVLISTAWSIVVLCRTGNAWADSPNPGTSSPASESQEPPREPEHKHISIVVNPLGLAIGRYSIQGEYIFARHHAITLNPFYTHAPLKVSVNGQEIDAGSLTGFGGELGYRLYTGSKGPNGFFIGPSFLYASYEQSGGTATLTGGTGEDSFDAYGVAVDLGGQAVVGPGIVIGGGVGLQYTKTSKEINTDNFNLASEILAAGGVRPRFLFALGFAF
jgi:hypothetical protein